MSHYFRLLLLLAVVSCSGSVDTKQIPGFYEFSIGSLRQEIKVEANGQYVNFFYREDSLIWADHGYWTQDKSGDQEGITFNGFRFGVFDEYRPGILGYKSSGKGYWFVVPEKSFFGVKKLCFDPDLDYCFFKKGALGYIAQK